MSEAYELYFTGGSSGGSKAKKYTVSFDLNYEGAAGAPEEQKVKKGGYAEAPEQPSREDFAFIGWFADENEQDWKNTFSFEENPISANTTLYAKWVDLTLDTDGDKLLDELEIYSGTDINNQDTDGDGLTDFQEVTELGTDALKPDTDDDGVNDYEEDLDGDGICNGEEYRIGSSPGSFDSDGDTLNDFEEVNTHKTSPIKTDTDDDGAADDWEISNGYNPLERNALFNVSDKSEEVSASNPVSASAELQLEGNRADTLTVNPVSPSQNALVSSEIPGYMGTAYDFKVDGEISSAKLTFEYDTSLGTVGEDFQPRIYYLNEETNMLEELPDQTVENGRVSVQTTHFSIYILLNKVEFDKVWKNEIKPPLSGEGNSDAALDISFVIDYSASMKTNDPNHIHKDVTKEFVSKLREGKDKASIVKFIKRAAVITELTGDKQALNKAIDSISYDSGYGSYSGTDGSTGIYAALGTLSSSAAEYKYIIFMTDGEDNRYTYSYDDLIEQAKSTNTVIYTIGLGSAKEDILQKVAASTGGKYYHATADNADSENILNLDEIFDDIESETIDLTTDTNDDGIPDYFAELIYDGILVLGNGSAEFMGVDFESNADYDGDGLKNGKELQVITKGNTVYLKMNSDPMTPNSDGDNMDDSKEVSAGSDPMKYSFKKSTVDEINNHSNYYYSLKAEQFEDDDFYIFIQSINAVIYGVWDVEEVFRDQMIDYFYTYSCEDYVNQLQMEYAKKAAVDMITGNISAVTSAMKDIELVGGRLSECTEYLPEIQKLAALKKEAKALKGRINALAPTDEYSKLTKLLDDDYMKLLDNIKKIENSAGGKIQLKINKIAKKYTNFMNKTIGDSRLEVGTTISLGFDLIEAGIDIADTIAAFSKVNANSAAFERNYDILSNLSVYGNRQYTRDAATAVINSFRAEYGSYGSELVQAIAKDTAAGCVNMIISLASQNPYVGAVVMVRDGIALITGIKDDIVQLYQIVCLYDMTCAAQSEFNSSVTAFKNYLYLRDEQTFDSVRLLNHAAQLRVVGERKYIDFMAYGGLLGLITDNSETEEAVGLTIKALKLNANALGLKIQDVK